MQRLSENRRAGENSKITVDAVVARGNGLSRANEEIGDFVVGKKGEVVGDPDDLREDTGRAW